MSIRSGRAKPDPQAAGKTEPLLIFSFSRFALRPNSRFVLDIYLPMKKLPLLLLGLTPAIFLPALQAEDPTSVPPMPDLLDLSEAHTEEQLLESFGFILGTQSGMVDYGLNEEQIEHLLTGMRAALQGEDPLHDMTDMQMAMEVYLQQMENRANQVRAPRNRALAEEAFAELAEREQAVRIREGLYVEMLEKGEGPKPGTGDTVQLHYHGQLIDGSVFDSSYQRGEPATFPLSGVIPGFALGLQQVPVGSIAVLYIHPDLAYGDQAQGGIPPGSMLIFRVQPLEIVADR